MSVASLDRGSASDAPAEDSAGASSSGAAPRRRRRPSLLAVAIALIVLIVVVKIFVAEPFRIPSQSMEPTLRPAQRPAEYHRLPAAADFPTVPLTPAPVRRKRANAAPPLP